MNIHHRISLTVLAVALALASNGNAHAQHDHSQHAAQSEAARPTTGAQSHAGHETKADADRTGQAVDHSTMDHSQMDHSQMDHSRHSDPSPVDHAAMGHGTPATQAPIEPIPAVTDADRAAAFPALDHHAMEHAPAINRFVLFNRLEAWDADHGTGQAWEGSAWIGSDLNRLWLRSEGEREGGRTEASDLEAMYGRSVSPWWDLLVGVKQDFRPADSQTWAAFGVQGMAPYKFELSATAYVGSGGRTAATLEAEYDLLLTNRLILQPLIEADLSFKDDPQHGVGTGLNKIEAGLRLRYEFTRRFAPYIGVVHERAFGNTADYRREEGEPARDTRVVVGVRLWF
ncbi:copper resistance protein B [Pseudoxanthomonas wuyuanensis]|uniref:Copper resistance protein B n=1 Tax=Pseudoxanthomonas wuyuanensis TaxID=1073196 RepID=A0A286DD31_9GAMM|nr:copper resistance protein B [Pseudoxanthomonas wuyuanensis]KAF1720726.1 copper resistance protein B [Pseudoxanthomonas wuyuanensis]SOD56567.1 copper resistance protein B [Pseudoxanthomonas wuyuanensis]